MEKEKTNLVDPDIRYKDSYIEALREFAEVDGSRDSIDIPEREKNFQDFLNKLQNERAGSEDKIPNFQYWLTEGDKYIGRINYRPELDDKFTFRGGNAGYAVRPSERGKGYALLMMQKIIEKAKSEGKTELLITCDTDNLPSIRVIEKAGGKYKNGDLDDKGIPFNRYIITL